MSEERIIVENEFEEIFKWLLSDMRECFSLEHYLIGRFAFDSGSARSIVRRYLARCSGYRYSRGFRAWLERCVGYSTKWIKSIMEISNNV
jgi:hypothetical protein